VAVGPRLWFLGEVSTKIDRSFPVDAPPEKVGAAMRNPALIEESEKARDAISVRITDREKTDQRHQYEVLVVSPARTVKGIDKTKTEDNRTTVTWNLPGLSAKWSWTGVHGPKVKIEGGYELKPNGAGTSLRMYAEIDIGLPLVGGMIEKKIKEGFESAWPDYVARVSKYAKS
jgi:carbon monoxide dehydrogenase subunit G